MTNLLNRSYKPFNNEGIFSKHSYIFILLIAVMGFGDLLKLPLLIAEYGSAILIIFIAGVIFIGLPIFIFEMSLGKKMHKSGMKIFQIFRRNNEIFGWIQATICLIILIYYSIILCWALVFFFQLWIPNFYHIVDISTITTSVGLNITPYSKYLFGPIIFVIWFIIAILFSINFKKYLGMICMSAVILLFLSIFGFLIFLLLKHNSYIGIDYILNFNLTSFTKIGIWTSGLGQVFFTMAIGTGIVITCSKYSKNTQEINSVAIIVCLANILFAIVSVLLTFSILGNEFSNQIAIHDFHHWLNINFGSSSNTTYSFIYIIKYFSYLSHPNYLFNLIIILIFATIIFASFATILILIMTVQDNLYEKSTKFQNIKFYAISSIIIAVIIIMGTYLLPYFSLNIFEEWLINNIILVFMIFECIFICSFQVTKIQGFFQYANNRSLFKVPLYYFSILLIFIVPLILIFIWLFGIVESIIHLVQLPHSQNLYNMKILYFSITIIAMSVIFFIIGSIVKKNKWFINNPFFVKLFLIYLPMSLILLLFLSLLDFSLYISVPTLPNNVWIHLFGLVFIWILLTSIPILMINLEDNSLKLKQFKYNKTK